MLDIETRKEDLVGNLKYGPWPKYLQNQTFRIHHFANRCAMTHAIVNIINYTDFKSDEKLVLVTIITKMLLPDRLDRVWLSYDEISRVTNLKKDKVARIVKKLRSEGFIINNYEGRLFFNDKRGMSYQITNKLFFYYHFAGKTVSEDMTFFEDELMVNNKDS
jgi:biotin operon repressor